MRQFLILCLALTLTISLQAQDVQEVRKGMSMGVQEAFEVDVVNLDAKEVEKVLMSYLKEYKGKKGPKKDRKSKEILVDDAEIPALSGNSIDLYATVAGKGEEATVNFWFDLGGAFLSQEGHPEKMEALSDWLYNFAKATRTRTIELELDNEEKLLKTMNKDYDKLKKEQEKLEAAIEKAKETIAQAEKDLETNASEQKNSQESIVDQQKIVEEVKDKLKKVN